MAPLHHSAEHCNSYNPWQTPIRTILTKVVCMLNYHKGRNDFIQDTLLRQRWCSKLNVSAGTDPFAAAEV